MPRVSVVNGSSTPGLDKEMFAWVAQNFGNITVTPTDKVVQWWFDGAIAYLTYGQTKGADIYWVFRKEEPVCKRPLLHLSDGVVAEFTVRNNGSVAVDARYLTE